DLAATEALWDDLLAAQAPAADGAIPAPGSLSSISDVRVEPMVHSTWDQSTWNGVNTFNYYTPNNSVCGCVATATAQIMRYWKWPVDPVEAGTYKCSVEKSYQNLTMQGGTYDWDNMPLTSSACTTDAQRQAIGKLTSDVGIASRMAYTLNLSGTFGADATAALRNRFGYACAKSVFIEDGDGTSQNIANHAASRNAILASLDAGMPAMIGIKRSGGGHQVVVDGYGYSGTTLYCHINCGWNGYQDAWYNLIGETITSHNYTVLGGVDYNIHPTYGPGDVISGRVTDTDGHPISGASVTLQPGNLTTRTCPTGIYAFLVGSAGDYSLTARSGDASSIRTVTISRIGTNATMGDHLADGSGYITAFGSVGNVWGVNFALATSATTLEPPAGLTASEGSTASIVISWTASADATSYTIYRGTSANPTSVLASGVTGTSYSDTSATPGIRWHYRVRAVDGADISDYSNSASGWRALSAPSSMSASDGTSSAAIELTWSASSGATSYTIYRGTSANPTDVLASGVTGTSYSDTSASAGATYHYRVKAVCALCESGYSPSDSGYRAEPFNVNLSASDGSSTAHVAVSWDAVPSAVSYTVYRGATASATTVLASGVTTTTYNDTSAAPGTRYWYRVKAFYASGSSEYSNADSGWRALSAPTGLSASDGTSTAQVNLSWTASAGASSYTIYRSVSANPTEVLVSGVTGTSYADTSAVAGVTYHYRVKAVCSLGISAYSNDDTGYRKTAMGATVSASDGLSADYIRVTWTAVSGAQTYNLYRCASADGSYDLIAEELDARTFNDTYATPGTRFWYKIKAAYASGNLSEFSDSDPGYRLLLPPTNVNASDGDNTASVTISWNESPGATAYNVYRSADEQTFTALARNVTSLSVSDTTAIPGHLYVYYVVATSPLCQSDISESDTGFIKLSPPTGVSATKGTHTDHVDIIWRAVDGATSYNVYYGTSDNPKGNLVSGLTTTSYVHMATNPSKPADASQVYYYRVKACNETDTSDYSLSNSGWRRPALNANVAASDGSTTEGVVVTWDAVPNAVSYKIFRGTADTPIVFSSGSRIADGVTATTYTDDTVVPGTVYWFRIKAVYAGGTESDASDYDTGFRKLSPPLALDATKGTLTDAIQITWTNVPAGASSYLIKRGTTSSVGAMELIKTSKTKRSYTDSSAEPGTRYWYSVAAAGGASTSVWTTAVSGWKKLAAPTGVKATDGTSDAFIGLSWAASTGATSYNIFRGDEEDTAPETLLASGVTGLAYEDATAVPGEYYNYRVTAVCALSESDYSKKDVGHRAILAPTCLSATDGTSFSTITVTWQPSPLAVSYTLYRGTDSAPTAIWTNNLTETTFTDTWYNIAKQTPLTPGTKYWYRVKANCATGTTSLYSESDSGFIALATPQNLIASQGASTANVALSWDAVTGAKSYLVMRDEDTNSVPYTVIKSGQSSAAYSDSSATPGKLYWYRVAAVSTGVTTGGCSVAVSGYRMLSAPTGLAASDGTSADGINLTWTAAAGAEWYLLYRGADAGSLELIDDNVGENAYCDTDVTPGVYYTYAVAAATCVCTGAVSTVDAGYRAVAGPPNFRASDGLYTNRIEISWDPVEGAASYTLYRGTSPTSLSGVVQAGLTTTNYTDVMGASVPKPGVIYYYRVQATAPSGTKGAYSETDSGHMLLSTPVLSAADGASAANVVLSWAAIFGAANYNIYRCEGTNDFPSALLKGKATGTSYTDSTAVPGVLYSYAIEACSSASITGRVSAADSGWRQVTAPTKVAATDGVSTENVAVTWAESTGALAYTVLRGESPSSLGVLASNVVGASYIDASAVPGTLYWYAVVADGKDYSSAPSASDRGHRLIPEPITVVATDGEATDRITVTWGETAFATSYIVYRGTADNPTSQYASNVLARTFIDADATPGVLYYYRVKAVCDGGTASDYSASDSGYRRLAAPSITGVTVSGGSLKPAWSKPTGASYYRVFRATAPDGEKTALGTWSTSTAYTDSTAVGGVTYWYFAQAAVNSSGDRPSDIGEGVAGTAPPANDAWANAILLSGRSGQTTGTNNGATIQTYEPQHAGVATATASVWWKWTAPADGTNVFTTAGTAFNAVLGVYTGTKITSLRAVTSDDGTAPDGAARVEIVATAGTTYYIAVAGRTASDIGAIALEWSPKEGGGPVTPTIPPDIVACGFVTVDGAARFRVSFNAEAGFAYLVQRKATLADAEWTTVQRVEAASDGVCAADIVPDSNAASAFFRVISEE
ncbi:MAG: C10 family peptidase, partial [Kiritimatiellae bacterium]|nr:C10 family peptidase [Kiritimatiellia bacterium]